MTQQVFFDGDKKQNIQSDDIDMIAKALSGDLAITITPATVDRVAGTYAISRLVTIALTDSLGNPHTWFNKTVTTACSIADTSTAGTAAIANTTLIFVNGVATKTVTAASAAWVAAETNTLTVANLVTPLGTVTGATSAETIVSA